MWSLYKLNGAEMDLKMVTLRKILYIALFQCTVATSIRKIEEHKYAWHPVHLCNMMILHFSNMIIKKEILLCYQLKVLSRET